MVLMQDIWPRAAIASVEITANATALPNGSFFFKSPLQ